MLCPIIFNSNTIELTVDTSCYLGLRLTLWYNLRGNKVLSDWSFFKQKTKSKLSFNSAFLASDLKTDLRYCVAHTHTQKMFGFYNIFKNINSVSLWNDLFYES